MSEDQNVGNSNAREDRERITLVLGKESVGIWRGIQRWKNMIREGNQYRTDLSPIVREHVEQTNLDPPRPED